MRCFQLTNRYMGKLDPFVFGKNTDYSAASNPIAPDFRVYCDLVPRLRALSQLGKVRDRE